MSKLILIVENGPSFSFYSAAAMPVGYEADTVRSSAEALEKFQSADHPRILVMVLPLPDAHGVGLMGLLKGRGVSIPVIVIAEDLDPKIAFECLNLGAFRVFDKSVSPEILAAAIEDAVATDQLLETENQIRWVLEDLHWAIEEIEELFRRPTERASSQAELPVAVLRLRSIYEKNQHWIDQLIENREVLNKKNRRLFSVGIGERVGSPYAPFNQ